MTKPRPAAVLVITIPLIMLVALPVVCAARADSPTQNSKEILYWYRSSNDTLVRACSPLDNSSLLMVYVGDATTPLRVTMPEGRWLAREGDNYDIPSLTIWRTRCINAIVVPSEDGGRVRYLQVYELNRHKISAVKNNPDQLYLTERGTYFIYKHRLCLVECAYEPGMSDDSDQPYVLSEYTINRDRLELFSRLTTRRSYPDIAQYYERPTTLPAGEDPLREFGLKWH